MNGQRKPRQPRWAPENPIRLAIMRAAKLTPTEVREVLEPIESAFTALREGVASEWQWAIIASAMNVAQAIERKGVVRGLKEHLASAETALQSIRLRAMASGQWVSTALYYQELDFIKTAIELHEYQMLQLSDGELRQCVAWAEAEIRSTGGRIVYFEDERKAA